jgi:hypothetical protein
MADAITTLTASAIASLAFQEFVKSGAGEFAKKFMGEAIAKMGQLRELILIDPQPISPSHTRSLPTMAVSYTNKIKTYFYSTTPLEIKVESQPILILWLTS